MTAGSPWADGVPPSLAWLIAREDGRRWLAELPAVLSKLQTKWSLERTGFAYGRGGNSCVIPVVREREQLVVKVQWRDPASLTEAAALRTWAGDGAVHLLDYEPAWHAFLLERCVPGTSLAEASHADPVGVLTDLARRLWRPAPEGFGSLHDEALGWRTTLDDIWVASGRSCERRLVDAAHEYLAFLPGTQADEHLVNQDLHGNNVLASEREPWLAIDPKPLSGERAFSGSSLIRSFEFGHEPKATRHRAERVVEELELDRDRTIAWTVAQTMAWSFRSRYRDIHHETVRALLTPPPGRPGARPGRTAGAERSCESNADAAMYGTPRLAIEEDEHVPS